jgi:hypothetical protein
MQLNGSGRIVWGIFIPNTVPVLNLDQAYGTLVRE